MKQGKRRPSLDPAQLGFTFDPPAPACEEADLAGLGRVIAAGVSRALREDSRSRQEIAGAMSALTGIAARRSCEENRPITISDLVTF